MEQKEKATIKATPEKCRYSNDYVVSCALYLIDGKSYTGAHFFLLEQIKKIRSKEDAGIPLTYTELAEWVYKLVKVYEENGGI